MQSSAAVEQNAEPELVTTLSNICVKRRAFAQAAVDAMLDAHSPEYKQLMKELQGADEQRLQELIQSTAAATPVKTYQRKKRQASDARLKRNKLDSSPAANKEQPKQDATATPAASSRPLDCSITERTPGMFCSPTRYRSVSFVDMQQATIERDVCNGLENNTAMDVYTQYSTTGAQDLIAAAANPYQTTPSKGETTADTRKASVRQANQFLAMRSTILWTILANLQRSWRTAADCNDAAWGDVQIDGQPAEQLKQKTLQLFGERLWTVEKFKLEMLTLIAVGCSAKAERWHDPELSSSGATAANGADGKKRVVAATVWAEWCRRNTVMTNEPSKGHYTVTHGACDGKRCVFCNKVFKLVKRNQRATTAPKPDDAWPSVVSIGTPQLDHGGDIERSDDVDYTMFCMPACAACASGVMAFADLAHMVPQCRKLVQQHLVQIGALEKPSTQLNAKQKRAALAFLHMNDTQQQLAEHLHATLGLIRVVFARYLTPVINSTTLYELRRALGDTSTLGMMFMDHVETLRLLSPEQSPVCDGGQTTLVGETVRIPFLVSREDVNPMLFIREFSAQVEEHVKLLERAWNVVSLQKISVKRCEALGVTAEHPDTPPKILYRNVFMLMHNTVLKALYVVNKFSFRLADVVCAPRTKRSHEEMQETDVSTASTDNAQTHKRQKKKKSAFRLHAGPKKVSKPQQIVLM